MTHDRKSNKSGEHEGMVSPHVTATCPTCGAYMLDPAKHRDFHEWLERQLAAASVGFPTGLLP